MNFELLCDGVIRATLGEAGIPTERVAQRIGSIADIPGVPTVQSLVPRSKNQDSPTSYSGIYGRDLFPLHTDMAHWHIPPRYLMLRCINPDIRVKTTVLQSKSILENEDEIDLKRSLFKPRRRLEGRLTVMRLYEEGKFRWDPVFIEPLNALASELHERVRTKLQSIRPMEVSLEHAGEFLIIDNWITLHGRTFVEDEGSARRIDRIYLTEILL
jgi:hypothetical protein